MKERKKICLVIPSLNTGGMERVMSELASHFSSKSDLEVHLVLYGKSPELFYTIPESVIIHKPKSKFNNKLRLLSTIRRLLYLRHEIRAIKPHSILSFGEYWNSFVLIATFGLPYPVFVSDRCQPDKSLGKIHDRLRSWFYPRAKGVIVQTKKAAEIYHKLIPKATIFTVANPIRSFDAGNKIKKQNIILSVGRLINTKHHDRLIKTFVKLEAPDWKLIIVGGNALKQNTESRLKQLITSLKAESKVILTGSIKNVDDYYKKSKIFAFTSSSEGFPNVIGEALSAGLPVVSYDCVAGPSEMIKDGENGFLVPVFDDFEFQKRLQVLIDNEELRKKMSENAEKSLKNFSVESIGGQYLDFLLSK